MGLYNPIDIETNTKSHIFEQEFCTLEKEEAAREIRWCVQGVFFSSFSVRLQMSAEIAERWIDACRSVYCNADICVLLSGDKWMHEIFVFGSSPELRKPIPKMLNTENDMVCVRGFSAGIGICLNMTRKMLKCCRSVTGKFEVRKVNKLGRLTKRQRFFFSFFFTQFRFCVVQM